jgi:squalene-hopene/tetraprenyl-beta-curcumene cyclase
MLHLVRVLWMTALILCIAPAMPGAEDPNRTPAPKDKVSGTRDEPFRETFSAGEAARYLDAGAHLVENNCYACHSTFTHLAARSIMDPLAEEVMKSRVMLERFNERMFDPQRAGQVKTHHISRVRVLSAVELARHDAATTGKLAPLTRRMLDFMWTYQKKDGGIDWIHVKEAPQAIDDYWPVAMMALGAGIAPDNYAQTPKASEGIEKLRGWLKAHPPQTLHERGLILLAHSFVGGVLTPDEVPAHAEAIFGAQHEDGGWSMTDLAPWVRKDKKPLDPALTDGYATGLLTFALARSGFASGDHRMRRAIGWMKTRQRSGGGWFTQSPFSRDRIATNTGTSLVIQALEACGELTRPEVTQAQFDLARAAADKAVPQGIFLPEQDDEKNPVPDPQSNDPAVTGPR